MVLITSDGQAVTSTDYWRTPNARAGLLLLSGNAGAIRVLVPDATRRLLDELPPTGRRVTLSRSTWEGRRTVVLQWDEPPESGLEPYSVDVDEAQCLQIGVEGGRVVPLVWYVREGTDGVREARRELVEREP